jgi:fatty-acid desaturase
LNNQPKSAPAVPDQDQFAVLNVGFLAIIHTGALSSVWNTSWGAVGVCFLLHAVCGGAFASAVTDCLLSYGEGWHNNHHAFPTSARHGLTFWEIDPAYAFIRLLKAVGLAWDIKTVSPNELQLRPR